MLAASMEKRLVKPTVGPRAAKMVAEMAGSMVVMKDLSSAAMGNSKAAKRVFLTADD